MKKFTRYLKGILVLFVVVLFNPSCKKDYHCNCVILTTVRSPSRVDTFSTRNITTYKHINNYRAQTLCMDKTVTAPQGTNTRTDEFDCVMSEAE